MIRICSWCKKVLGKKPPYTDPDKETHTICATCRKQMKINPSSGPIDEHAKRELLLYGDNDADLYRQMFLPIIRNYARKIQNGTYDHQRGIQGWLNYYTVAAQKYVKEFGSGGPIDRMFNKATRLAAATEQEASEYEKIVNGEYSNLNPSAAWHRSQRRQAVTQDRQAARIGRQDLSDFYHGKEIAHTESEMRGNPMKKRMSGVKKAMLVYQAGIANVFTVKAFNLADYGRDAHRLYQGDFRSAEMYAYGLAAAGAVIRTAACNQAGDITHARWTDDLDSQPFSDRFRPVNENPGRSKPTYQAGWQVSGDPRARYKVSGRGNRWTYFATLEEARRFADQIFKRTGNIVAVEATKTKQNPIAIYGLGNPPRSNGRAVHAKIAGVIYNRLIEIRAEKTQHRPGFYKHPFSARSQVQVLALDNGDLLVHSTVGVKLWKKD